MDESESTDNHPDLPTEPPVSEIPGASDPPDEPRQPPLGIIHIMTWTAVCAVILAAYSPFIGSSEDLGGFAYAFVVLDLLWSLIYGAAIGSVVLFLYRRLTRGAAFPVQPGHWLLLIIGTGCIVSWSADALIPWIDSLVGGRRSHGAIFALSNVVTYGTGVALFSCAAWHIRDALCWRLLFCFRTVECFLISVLSLVVVWQLMPHSSFSMALEDPWPCCGSLWAAWTVVAVIVDFGKSRQRDWLHWVGIAVVLTDGALNLCNLLIGGSF